MLPSKENGEVFFFFDESIVTVLLTMRKGSGEEKRSLFFSRMTNAYRGAFIIP